MNTTLTAVIEREDDLYVALCPEFDVVSVCQKTGEVLDPEGLSGLLAG